MNGRTAQHAFRGRPVHPRRCYRGRMPPRGCPTHRKGDDCGPWGVTDQCGGQRLHPNYRPSTPPRPRPPNNACGRRSPTEWTFTHPHLLIHRHHLVLHMHQRAQTPTPSPTYAPTSAHTYTHPYICTNERTHTYARTRTAHCKPL